MTDTNNHHRLDYVEFGTADVAAAQKAGAQIVKPIFSFPGGRRFHFVEPGGNELAVWGE
jgi:predicted enzyme related to lactoylglutathione lyase